MVPLLRSLSFPAAILLVAGVLSGCQAATNAPVSAEVLMDKAGQTILLEDFSYPDTNEPQVTSSIVTLEPGAETGLHFHEAPMYAYILEGTLEVTYQREGGEETKIYREGEAIMEGLDTPHNGRNATNSVVRVLVVNMGSPDLENTVMLN
jgi:quercetin dioxygenase-like cupin family protein